MRVRAKVITGQDEVFDITEATTVENFRSLVATRLNIEENKIRLLFQGRFLGDKTKTLKDCGVQDGYVVHVVEQLENVRSLPTYAGEEQRRDEPRRRNTGGNWNSRRVLIPPVRSMISVIRSGDLGEPERFQAVVQRAIDEMTALPADMRESIGVDAANGRLTLRFPAFHCPHITSPALERMFLIDKGLNALRFFRNTADVENGICQAIDAILEGSTIDNAELIELAQSFGATMESYTDKYIRPPEYDNDDPESATYQGRYQHIAGQRENRGGAPYVARHALASDLVNKLNSIHGEYSNFQPLIERYNRILSSHYVFDIESRDRITTDGRANLFCVYSHHIQRSLHSFSHLFHHASDLQVKFEDPLPRRLYPQNDIFRLQNPAQGELTFELIAPTETRTTSRHRQQRAIDMFRNSDTDPQRLVSSLVSLSPTGYVRRTAAVPIGIGIPLSIRSGPGLPRGGILASLGGADQIDLSNLLNNSVAQGHRPTPARPTGEGPDPLEPFRSLTHEQLEEYARVMLTALSHITPASPNESRTENVFEQFFIRLLDSGIASIASMHGPEFAHNMARHVSTDPLLNLPHIPSFALRHIPLPPEIVRDNLQRTLQSQRSRTVSRAVPFTPSSLLRNVSAMLDGNQDFGTNMEVRIGAEPRPASATVRNGTGLSTGAGATTGTTAATAANSNSATRSQAEDGTPSISAQADELVQQIRAAAELIGSPSVSGLPHRPAQQFHHTNSVGTRLPMLNADLAGRTFAMASGISANTSTTRNGNISEQIVPIDPFLNCENRFTNAFTNPPELWTHYEQIVRTNTSNSASTSSANTTSNSSSGRTNPYQNVQSETSAAPPGELNIWLNSSGDILIPDTEEELVNIIQHAMRWLLSLIRENDVTRIDQVAGRGRARGPIPGTIQADLIMERRREAVRTRSQNVRAPPNAIEINIASIGEGPDNADLSSILEPILDSIMGDNQGEEEIHVIASMAGPSQNDSAVESESSPPEAQPTPPEEETMNIDEEEVVPEQGTSPRAKKRKTEVGAASSTGSQASTFIPPRSTIPNNRWREIVDRDVERQRENTAETTFSRGYLLGHPSNARSVTASIPNLEASMVRSSSITGMVDTLDHLSVRSIPQSPQTSTLDFMDETD